LRDSRHGYRRPFLTRLATSTALIGAASAVQAGSPVAIPANMLPQGGHFVAGSGSIGTQGFTETITQTSQRGIIDFSSFSIGKSGSVRISNGMGATLDRVTGGNLSQIMGTLTSGQLFGTDTASFVQMFDSRNAGSRTLSASGSVQDGNNGGNYAITFVTAAGTINKEALTVTAASQTRIYDGTTSSGLTPTITSGQLFGTDTASFVQMFDSRNAGSRTLTASGSVNDGNSGGNYAITFVTAAGTINKEALTVTALSDKCCVRQQGVRRDHGLDGERAGDGAQRR